MKKGAVNIWMIGFFVLVGVLIFVAGSFFPNLLKKGPMVSPTSVISPTPTVFQVIPPTVGETISPPTPTIQELSALEQIRAAFSKKYTRPVEEVTVSISKQTGSYAQGGVKFSGEIGGGWFLAYKSADGWIIVQDGNGTVSCETIAPYNFPTDMVPECVDNNGNLITR